MSREQTKQELEELHGTPADFARQVMLAYSDGHLTIRSARAAIRVYEAEWAEAEPATAPAGPVEPFAGLPSALVDKAAYAVLKEQGVDLTIDPSAFYPVESQMRAAFRAIGLAEMLAVLTQAVQWGQHPAVRRGELDQMSPGWLAKFQAVLAETERVKTTDGSENKETD